jgi:hypothetical protein
MKVPVLRHDARRPQALALAPPIGFECATSHIERASPTAEEALGAHAAPTVAIAVAGEFVVTGAYDCTVRVWTPPEERPLQCRAVLRGHRDAVSCVAACRTHRLVASGSFDRTIRLWEPVEGVAFAVVQAGGRLRAVALRGALLVSSSDDRPAICLWELRMHAQSVHTCQPMGTICCEHQGTITTLAADEDGGRVISGDVWGMVRVWLPTLTRPGEHLSAQQLPEITKKGMLSPDTLREIAWKYPCFAVSGTRMTDGSPLAFNACSP